MSFSIVKIDNNIKNISKKFSTLINKNNLVGLNNFLASDLFTKLLDDDKIAVILSNDNPLQQAFSKPVEIIEAILNAPSLVSLPLELKYKILVTEFQKNGNIKSLQELAIEKSPAYLKVILDNRLMQDLNGNKLSLIFKTQFSNEKLFFEVIARKKNDYIETALNSNSFKQLDHFQQIDILTCASKHGNMPLVVAVKQKTTDNIVAFLNSNAFKEFPQNAKTALLEKQDLNGKTILHYASKEGYRYLEVILDSEFLNSIDDQDQVYKIFILKDSSDITLLHDIIISSHKKK